MTTDADASPTSLTQKTVVGAAWLFLWRMVTRSLGLVSTLVLARLLIPADFGLVAMATTFSYGVEALSQLGLQEALVRRREEGFDLHHTAFTLQLGRAFITGCVIAAGAPMAAAYFQEPRLLNVLLVLAAVTFLNGFENVGIAEFRRAMRYNMQFKLMSLTRIAGFLTTLTFALLGVGYWAMLLGIAVSSVARVALTYHLHPFRPRLHLLRWRELASFSFWTWATAAASLVWDRCDPFLLGPAFGSAKLGLYLLAMEIAWMPMSEMVAPAADAVFAAFARAQKDGKSSLHHAPEVAGMILLAVAPAVLSVSAAAGPMVNVLLGEKWQAAWPIAAVLTWACVFSPYSYICSMALVANGHVRRNFIVNATVSVVKLSVLLTVLSFTQNPLTLGAATVACFFVEAILFLIMIRGVGGVYLRGVLGGLARIVLAGGLAAAIIAWSGLGWHGGLGSVPSDLVRGFEIGGLATSVFGLAVIAQWRAIGCPAGAEARLVALVSERVVKAGSFLSKRRMRFL